MKTGFPILTLWDDKGINSPRLKFLWPKPAEPCGGLSTCLPGIDGNALLGGFGGAIFFVVFARDYNALTRLGYLLVSWVGGYYAGIEALGRGLTQTSGMAAFVAATLCVTGGIGMLEWMRGGELPSWMRGLLRRRGGKSDG